VIAAKRAVNSEPQGHAVMFAGANDAMERIIVAAVGGPCAVADPGVPGRFAVPLAKPVVTSLDEA
jgi:hypothetical protein